MRNGVRSLLVRANITRRIPAKGRGRLAFASSAAAVSFGWLGWQSYQSSAVEASPIARAKEGGDGAAAAEEPAPRKSEDKHAWPGRPGLTRIVGDNWKEVCV